MVSYVHTNIPVNVIVRIAHPRSGHRQGQETILAPSADNQSHNYDTERSKPPSFSIYTRVKRIELQQDEIGELSI